MRKATSSSLDWVADARALRTAPPAQLDPAVCADYDRVSACFGMPGFTAYGGMVIGKPQPGETVVVAAASGPSGRWSQLAKLAGAGRSALPAARRNAPLSKTSSALTRRSDSPVPPIFSPAGGRLSECVDVYFENVAARSGRRGLPLLNKYARVPVCGLNRPVQRCERYEEPTACGHNARDPVESLTLRGSQLRICPRSTTWNSCEKSAPALPTAAFTIAGHRRRAGECSGSLHWHA